VSEKDKTMKISDQRGSAMIETVVSLFVLAIGLMGTLAMQAKGVNSTKRASLATEANFLAADMVDRIMAYDSADTPDDDNHFAGFNTSTATVSDPGCSETGCAKTAQNSNDQVQFDKWEWSEQIKRSLPGGIGDIQYAEDSDGNGVYTIQLMWQQEEAFASSTCAVSDNDLACLEYRFRI